jgi:DNA-binding MarR family transcriptional regulator
MDAPTGPTPAADRLLYTANRFARSLNRAAEHTAMAHGITLPQLLALQVLGEGDGLSNAALARRIFVSAQASHVVCRELLDAGLIERSPHPTNRRVQLVRLTAQGRGVLQECTVELRNLEDRLARTLPRTWDAPLPAILHTAAEALAGGYFGDADAEAAARARAAGHRRQSGSA